MEIALAGSGKKTSLAARLPRKMKLVAIPVLAMHAATRGAVGHPEFDLGTAQPEAIIGAPAMWCPNPPDTSCLRVKGFSMTPSILDGDIIAVDTSQNDPEKLASKIVVAWHRQRGLSLARFRRMNGTHLLESENPDY
ncbi:MAG: S24 family peptidase, partial [Terriglobales bacterium]